LFHLFVIRVIESVNGLNKPGWLKNPGIKVTPSSIPNQFILHSGTTAEEEPAFDTNYL
jgi:hypothetical protein